MRPGTGVEGCAACRAGTSSRAHLHGRGRGRGVPSRFGVVAVLGLPRDGDSPGISPEQFIPHSGAMSTAGGSGGCEVDRYSPLDGDSSVTPMPLGVELCTGKSPL